MTPPQVKQERGLPQVPPEVAQQAVQWLVELQSGSADEQVRAGLRSWLASHPDHLRAWQHIERVNQRLAALSAATAPATVHEILASADQTANRSRRRAIKTMLVLAAGGSGAWMAHYFDLFGSSGEQRTALGERRTLMLADGTRVVLGSATRMQVQYDQTQRRLHLLQGEVMVTTARDNYPQPRPLTVATAQGVVQPLGTVFAVRIQEQSTRVDVFEQQVRLIPRDAPDSVITLHAGQRSSFTSAQIAPPLALDAGAGAWADGMLVAANMRLQDLLEEVSRYRRGYLSCAPEIADWRVSGTYPLDDTDRILQALSMSQPLQLHYLTRYWVRLVPLPGRA